MIEALTDRIVLEAWAGSRDGPAGERADAMLACALAAAGGDPPGGRDPRDWPLARRNAALAELRASRWGTQVEALVACPACGCELSVELDLALVAPLAEVGDEDPLFRLPTRADVHAAAQAADPRRALVERCLTQPCSELTAPALEAIAAAMEVADPIGALEVALSCPDCDQRWDEPLELDEFLGDEARHDARAIAAEVHELALAYGWSEPEILALPTARRRLYLELVGG